jgi:cation diffusion facilitator family transporter
VNEPQAPAVHGPVLPERTAAHEQADRQAANRAITVSAVGLALTGGIELVLAVLTGSVALLGDALHNLADVSTSAVVFLGFFISKREPTRAYPYGYERAEDLAGFGVALVIWASAVFAGYQSYEKLVKNAGTNLVLVGMAAAVVGMVGNFAVARYKAVVGQRIQSSTLQAEAKHSWLDVMSSVGAFIGLIGVGLGFRWADPVAGFAVMLFICHVGYEVTHDICYHLMDGVEPEYLTAAEDAARTIPGVWAACVRGRWLGRSLSLDVETDLPGTTTLQEARKLGLEVERAVRGAVREARRVNCVPRERDT